MTISGDLLTISTAHRVALLNRTSAALISGVITTAGLVFLVAKPLSKLGVDAINDQECGVFLIVVGIALAVASAVAFATNVVSIDRANNKLIKGRKSISLANCCSVSIEILPNAEGGTIIRIVLNRFGNRAVVLWDEPDISDATRIAAEVASFLFLPL